MTYDESGLYELVDEYITQEMLRFEGERGVEDLNKLAFALGYRETPFKFGTVLEQFLADNPGAQAAIVDWVMSMEIPEWKEEIETHLKEKSEDDEDEYED